MLETVASVMAREPCLDLSEMQHDDHYDQEKSCHVEDNRGM
jgi:hypothetical protein